MFLPWLFLFLSIGHYALIVSRNLLLKIGKHDQIVKHKQIKESGFDLVTVWECQWDKEVNEDQLPHSRADIEHLKL